MHATDRFGISMTRFILLLALAIAGWLIYKMYFKSLLQQGKAGKIKIALIIAGMLFMILAVTRRAHILFAILGAAMTQIMRIAPLFVRFLPMFKQFIQPSGMSNSGSGNVSKVRTTLLVMTLDHDSGQIDGEITGGTFQGKTLSNLSQAEIAQLLEECRAQDPEGERLLQSYVARTYGADGSDETQGDHSQRSSQGQSAQSSAALPSQEEAREILGIDASADKDEIVAAHRKLMGKLHPDKGGSNYLAAKINAAKEVLIQTTDQTP